MREVCPGGATNYTVQHTRGRLAEVSPFDIRVSVEAPRACAEPYRAGSGTKSVTELGCVDWYQYPVSSDATGKGHPGLAVGRTPYQ